MGRMECASACMMDSHVIDREYYGQLAANLKTHIENFRRWGPEGGTVGSVIPIRNISRSRFISYQNAYGAKGDILKQEVFGEYGNEKALPVFEAIDSFFEKEMDLDVSRDNL